MFLSRRSVFNYESNPYYKPLGAFNLTGPLVDSAIPNCARYAYLRLQEACENKTLQKYWIRPSGGFGNAKEWYYTTTLSKGILPKLGAVACFDGQYGHVAIVEDINPDGTVQLSESNYSADKSVRGWRFWNYRKSVPCIPGKQTLPGCGPFIGYIYPPVEDLRVDRDINRLQVFVDEADHNIRVAPGLDSDIVLEGSYPLEGIYNVLASEEVDGYLWVKLEEGHWIAICGEMELLQAENIKDELIAIYEALGSVIMKL